MQGTVKTLPRTKIYYNINITSNPKEGEFESDAKFSVVLNQALLDDVSQYQFMLQKFKIDSESIPLFHIDVQQPQMYVIPGNNYLTNYKIYTVVGGITYYVRLEYNRVGYKPAIIVKTQGGLYWYDNRDPIFEIFSYDAFITVINNGLTALYNKIGDTTLIPLFFSYDNYYHKIFQ